MARGPWSTYSAMHVHFARGLEGVVSDGIVFLVWGTGFSLNTSVQETNIFRTKILRTGQL